MQASPSDAALAWVKGAIEGVVAAGVVVKRNETLPESIDGIPGYISLLDPTEESVDREDMIGLANPAYSFETEVAIEIYVADPDDGTRTSRLQALAGTVAGVVIGDRTMGGTVSVAILRPAMSTHVQESKGTVPVGRMTFPLLLVYDTDNPLG